MHDVIHHKNIIYTYKGKALFYVCICAYSSVGEVVLKKAAVLCGKYSTIKLVLAKKNKSKIDMHMKRCYGGAKRKEAQKIKHGTVQVWLQATQGWERCRR